MSHQTPDSLCNDEKEIWRTIQKELEEIGITVRAFEANKAFILEWFTNAVAEGAFEEQPTDDAASLAHLDPISAEQPAYGSVARLDLSDVRRDGNSYLVVR
jgi:hypothetical protein